MVQPIPATAWSAVVHAYGGAVTVEKRPVYPPGPGEALVRIATSPINPSDLLYIMGEYGFRKPLPMIPGFEASGQIVAVGEGVSEALIGLRVACTYGTMDGTWAEYMRTAATNCIPLPDHIDLEHGAMLIANPLTAHLLLDKASGMKAVVQTAAASALGRMIIRLAQRRGIQVINVVHRQEQVSDLQALGADHVLNSSDPAFETRLRELCHNLGAHLAFESVAGPLSGQILSALPDASTLIVYGALSLQPCAIPPAELIFRKKLVDGFWLIDWLSGSSMESLVSIVTEVFSAAESDYKTEVRAHYPLPEVAAAINDYMNHMTGGKVLLVP